MPQHDHHEHDHHHDDDNRPPVSAILAAHAARQKRQSASAILRGLSRRQALGVLGATGAAVTLASCGGSSPTSPGSASDGSTATGSTNSTCAVAPAETIGPYPSLADFFRSDIREGRSGIPVALTIQVVNVTTGCTPIEDAAVDIWQCDADGHYSQYNQQGYNGASQTFLRGVQTTGSDGRVTFTTIYPGWYAGRATHIHVEVTIDGRSAKVTQMAFLAGITQAVYSSSVYAARGQNPTSNSSDMVFADSLAAETATITGDISAGYAATFMVGVSS